jgi:threonine synthase
MRSDVSTGFELRCTRCSAHLPPTSEGPCHCGGIVTVQWDLELAGRTITRRILAERPANMLRYREILPLLDVEPMLPALMTPLHEVPDLAAALGVASVAVKLEGSQPTGSLKDRASAVGVARADALGFRDVACASSGNAAASMAGLAAAQGLRAAVFLPRGAPLQKLIQLRAYGARAVVVDGPYEVAYQMCEQAAPRFGWYNRNCAQNPYLVEGKKTCGLEIAEQTAGDPPDWVAIPIGDGCTIVGIWKGLQELHALGLTPSVPRLLGVQAATAATVRDAWQESTDIEAVEGRYAAPASLADSIAVTHPHNGDRAVDAVRASGGSIVSVEDALIAEATLELPRRTGVFAEPASAAAVAGVRAARELGIMSGDARVVVVATGTGFKNLGVMERLIGAMPDPVEPSIEKIEASLAAYG